MREAVRWRKASVLDVMPILAIERGAEAAPQWSEELWRRTLEDVGEPKREVLVAESAVGVCGFLVASVVGDVAELESVVVAKSVWRQGIGGELCRRSMEWAKGCGAKVMELEVRVSNEQARQLYERVGFAEQGRRRNYYTEPTEDAVLMVAAL